MQKEWIWNVLAKSDIVHIGCALTTARLQPEDIAAAQLLYFIHVTLRSYRFSDVLLSYKINQNRRGKRNVSDLT